MSGVFPVNPVLLVDDDEVWLRSLSVLLKRKVGITNIVTCSDPLEVMPMLAARAVSIVLLDFTMPGLMGDQVLVKIKNEFPEIPVILLTGSDQVDIAVKCMQRGAFDYFVKSHDVDRILSGIQRAIHMHDIMHENRLLNSGFLNDSGPDKADAFEGMWTRSFRMFRIFRYLEAVASSSVPVLFIGEPSTGKSTLAKALHATGEKSGNFIHCRIADHGDFLPDALCGRKHNSGFLDQSEGGTLYLDGIEHLSRLGEDFLCDLIDSPQFTTEPGGKPRWFTGRIAASTSVDLDSISGMKRLLVKFSSHAIQVPSLRERREDLPVLLDCLLDEAAHIYKKSRPTPPPELITLLGTYNFPGNIGELRKMVLDAVIAHAGGILSMDIFRERIFNHQSGEDSNVPLAQFTGPRLPTLAEVQDILINEAYRRTQGNQGVMANMLGITRTAINKRLNKD